MPNENAMKNLNGENSDSLDSGTVDPRTIDPINDQSGAPREIRPNDKVGRTLGTSTGEEEHAFVGGGWQGSDDDTSTAASDNEAHVKPADEEDPTGRAFGGGIAPGAGGVADLMGRPVEGAKEW